MSCPYQNQAADGLPFELIVTRESKKGAWVFGWVREQDSGTDFEQSDWAHSPCVMGDTRCSMHA
jgi:hypothetical protein